METERIETSIGWETGDVDKGAQRVERAFDRMDAAEKKAIKAAQARQAEANRAEIDLAKKSIADEAKLRKAASDERMALSKREYERLSTLEKGRQAELAQSFRVNQIRAGINPGAVHSVHPVHSVHGPHGGGFLGGQTRMVGDVLDSVTGTPGWVLKLRALEHIGPMLGRLAVPAGGAMALAAIGYEGYRSNSRMIAGTEGLQRAMGEGYQSPWMTNPLTAPLLRRLPNWMQPDPTPSHASAQSAAGMDQQREQIVAEAKEAQDSRGGAGSFARQFLKILPGNFVAGSMVERREKESFAKEERGQDRIQGIDARQAELINAGSAARRMGEMIDPLQGELARNQLEMQQRTASAADEFRAGKSSPARYTAERKAAESDRETADFTANRRDQQTRIGLNEEARLNVNRRSGGNEVSAATIRLQEAQHAREIAVGEVEQKAADNKVDAAKTELEIADRNLKTRTAALAIDLETAKAQGNAEERAMQAARNEEAKALAAQSFLLTSKSATEEERAQAAVAVQRAQTATVLLEREQAGAKLRAATSDSVAAIRLKGAAAGVGVGAEPAQRAALEAGADAAQKELDAANARAETEHKSRESVEAQNRALEQMANAQLQLKAHVLETARVRREELAGLQTESAALRLENVGRGDRGSLLSSRHSTDEAQYEAARAGDSNKARELGEQQKARETGTYLSKFYKPDGSKVDRGKLNREERDRRMAEKKLQRASTRFEKEGRDPLTGRLLHAEKGMHSGRLDGDTSLAAVHLDSGGDRMGTTEWRAQVGTRMGPASHLAGPGHMGDTIGDIDRAGLGPKSNSPEGRAAADKSTGAGSIADLIKLLDHRLPPASN